jgi:PII-like signaling protein
MKLEGEGKLLRIFLGESDRISGRPLYEALVLKAKEQGLAGATVLRGIQGFGAASRIHTAKILRLSEDLPIVVEIVDTEERITAFMSVVDAMFKDSGSGGLVTLERAQVIRYTQGK